MNGTTDPDGDARRTAAEVQCSLPPDATVVGTARAAASDRIAATGALEEARTQALAHVSEAKESLGRLDLSEERLRALSLVADGVVERYA